MPTIQEEFGKFRNAWEEFKAANDKRLAEIEKKGEATAETRAQVDKLNAALDAQQQALTKRLDEIETKAKRPQAGDEQKAQEAQRRKAAFEHVLRYGTMPPADLAPYAMKAKQDGSERKALTLGDDTQAGYLAMPPEQVSEIIKGIVEFSPIRQIARVIQTSAGSISVPKRTGTFAAAWVAETGTRAETTGLTYGRENIPVHEMYAMADVSRAMLEDSAFNLEAELNAEFAEQFGVAEGTACVSGNGVGKPDGVMTNTVIPTTNSGSASTLLADGLITLFYALKDGYARNATWLMRRATEGVIRTLKETTGNAYVWQPGLQVGSPNLLLGQPLLNSPDMPAIAGAAEPIILGDFRRGYVIADRIDITVQRDPYTQATSGNVRFHAWKRVGGQVVIAEAFRTQTIAT